LKVPSTHNPLVGKPAAFLLANCNCLPLRNYFNLRCRWS